MCGKLLDGRFGRRRAQSRCVSVKPVEHLDISEPGAVLLDRCVQIELALLDLLERGDGGDHLRHRGDPKQRVGGDRLVLSDGPRPGRALVDSPVAIGRHRHDIWYGTRIYRAP